MADMLIEARLDELPRLYRSQLGLTQVCPEFGTLSCVDCAFGEAKALDDCDYHCAWCAHYQECPCSAAGWRNRQELLREKG